MSDNLLFVDDFNELAEADRQPWKVIISDDAPEIHAVTKLALKDFEFEDRPLNFLNAFSGEETIKMVEENPDAALLLLDVVMEEENSGLEVVRKIRNELKNHHIRIILRTGQPGYAPERRVILEYDINDYREKTELTAQKLFTSVTSALRSYRDILIIEKNRQGLAYILEETNRIFKLKTIQEFASTTYQAIINYLPSANPLTKPKGCVAMINGQDMTILAGETTCNKDLIESALTSTEPLITEKFFLEHIQTRKGEHILIYVETEGGLNPIEQEILRTFSSPLKISLENIQLIHAIQKQSDQLEQSLKEKQIMLKEIHHRVKNNLQIISSLLNMQTDKLENPRDTELFQESKSRILSMALVHEKLYQSSDLAGIDLGDYLNTMAMELLYTYDHYRNVDLDIETIEILIGIDVAIPCGLIINEILTNALKYAFDKDVGGKIFFRLTKEENRNHLEIWDDGKGLPEGIDIENSSTLGMQLISLLTKQIGGDLEIKNNPGAYFKLSFDQKPVLPELE